MATLILLLTAASEPGSLLAPDAASGEKAAMRLDMGEVDVRFEGLRSTRGMIRACLTREPRYFPHCDKDPASYKASVAAANGAQLRFAGVTPGDYALTVLHDENSNFKADMMFGIPREGVGFSRNPKLVMSAPKFDAVRFRVAAAPTAQTIKFQYFL